MTTEFASLPGINNIYCPDSACTNVRDWLVKKPAAVPLWVLGSLMAVLGIVQMLRSQNAYNSRVGRVALGITILCLGLSMFLRAAITLNAGDKTALYIASMIFNYYSGSGLCGAVTMNGHLISTDFQPMTRKRGIIYLVISFITSMSLFALYIGGAVLMFHPHNNNTSTGLRCIQAALGIMLALFTYNVSLYIYYMRTVRAHLSLCRILLVVVFAVLGFIWNGFMFARTFVQLDNPARSSQVMFFLLSYLPMIVGFIALVLFDYPLRRKVNEPLVINNKWENEILDKEFTEIIKRFSNNGGEIHEP